MLSFISVQTYQHIFMHEYTEGEPDSVGLVWGTDPYVRLNGHYPSICAIRSENNLSTFLYDFEYGQTYYCRSFAKKEGKMNLYTPLVTQEEYQQQESRSVLEKLYGNSLKRFVNALYQGEKMKKEDIQELSDFLKEMEEDQEE